MPTFQANIQHFERQGGWYYVPAPDKLVTPLLPKAERGLIAITATLNDTVWSTSLLPMGDGTHFIALSKKMLNKYSLHVGDEVRVSFVSRQR